MPHELSPSSAAPLAAKVADRVLELPRSSARSLIAIAGAPASGKSTLAAMVCAELNRRGVVTSLVAMDGFHLDNAILDARGLRSRKGAPETFDLSGFAALLDRLLQGGEVIAPTFDRVRDVSVGSSAVISPETGLVVVEGNYLMLDEPGWRELADRWDLSVFLNVPRPELARRLFDRWIEHGFPPDEARKKAEGNDLPNADRIIENRLSANMVVTA